MFDELNILNGRNILTIPQFFHGLGLPRDKERERVDLAREIESVMLFIFAYMASGGANPAGLLAEKYSEVVRKYIEIDITLDLYIRWMSEQIVNADVDDEYKLSDERAMVIGENEAHSVMNYEEYSEAVRTGKTTKVWMTQLDNRVRGTHRLAQGQEVPINEPFKVGDSLLMYPRDYSLGASPEEIVNCRCWATYR